MITSLNLVFVCVVCTYVCMQNGTCGMRGGMFVCMCMCVCVCVCMCVCECVHLGKLPTLLALPHSHLHIHIHPLDCTLHIHHTLVSTELQ